MKNLQNVLGTHFIEEFKNVCTYTLYNSFLGGSQFILINSFIPTWTLLSWFKQYLLHLFWDV